MYLIYPLENHESILSVTALNDKFIQETTFFPLYLFPNELICKSPYSFIVRFKHSFTVTLFILLVNAYWYLQQGTRG